MPTTNRMPARRPEDVLEDQRKFFPGVVKNNMTKLKGLFARKARSNITQLGLVKTGNLRKHIKGRLYRRGLGVRAVILSGAAYGYIHHGFTGKITQRAWSKPESELKQPRRRALIGKRSWQHRARPFLTESDVISDIRQTDQRIAKQMQNLTK